MWARQKVLTCDIIRHTLYLWAHICDEIQLNRQRCRISISIFGFSSCYLQAFNSNAINDKGPKAQSARIADRRSQSQKPAPMAKRLHQTATDHLVRGELAEGGLSRGPEIMGTHIQDQIDVEVCSKRVLAFGALCGWQLNCKIIIFITNLTATTAVEDSPSATRSAASNEMEINCPERDKKGVIVPRSNTGIPMSD